MTSASDELAATALSATRLRWNELIPDVPVASRDIFIENSA